MCQRAGGVALLIGFLISEHQLLGSNPSINMVRSSTWEVEAVESGVQGHSPPHSNLQVILGF